MGDRRDWPVEDIEPGWLVYIGTWQSVWAAIATEAGADAGDRVWLFIRGQSGPIEFQKGATILARPPMNEEGRPDAMSDGNTDRYQNVERRLRDSEGAEATLEAFIRTRRVLRKSWQEISFDLWGVTGVRINPETLRRWAQPATPDAGVATDEEV